MKNKNWIVGLFFFAFVGCSHILERDAYVPRTKTDIKIESIKEKLYAQYAQWKGAKYKLGGLSKKGIDCSGFVFVTFKSKLGIALPRTTSLQVKTGKYIERNKLQAGDLVFFKTGRSFRHVGIYLEHDKFLHASTSLGVTISKLNNRYWKSKYWKAKRIKT